MVPGGESSDGEDATGPDWIDATRGRRELPPEPLELRMSVVEYAERPDRCTIYQPGLTPEERMATWISVDRSLVESLAANR